MFTGCDWSYSLKDKDILDRFHDTSSKAIHTGSFSYQIIAWYLLFYLYDLDIRAGSSFESLLTEIEGLKNNRKLVIIVGEVVVDTETLVAQTRNRMWRALTGHYKYDSSLKDSQNFVFNHVNSKISLVIMYADLVGSTNMSMTLPVDKMVTITRTFTHEMTSTVRIYGGYVLKYVGDAIIAFFPSGYNKLLACDNAVQCAKSMITVIKNGINPILNQYDYPELSVKIGIDGKTLTLEMTKGSGFIIILRFSCNTDVPFYALIMFVMIYVGNNVRTTSERKSK